VGTTDLREIKIASDLKLHPWEHSSIFFLFLRNLLT